MNAFQILLSQIDSFIRKFYKNQIIKGVLLFLAIFLFSFLVTVVGEYFGHFGPKVRAFFFFSFIIINGLILLNYLVIPILKLISFGKRINRYQAAEIIGSFFPEVSDRLKNTLQLQDSLDSLETVESKCKKRKCMEPEINLFYLLLKDKITLDAELLKSKQEIINNLKKVLETKNTYDLKLNAYYFCFIVSFIINLYLSTSI